MTEPTPDALDNDGQTLLVCERCGVSATVQIRTEEGGFLTAAEYKALSAVISEVVVCLDCAEATGRA